ncbi:CBO0543 family protein [Bacillus sp. 165]|uniref:CBO0543 family protein n=1 Tax=Bacillus sp. 165 TaxID=1529117 RepID=UPI0024695E40|nr:CBO0543 family protein [Bacillus sp. 165]
MNTAQRLKKSNLLFWQKTISSFEKKQKTNNCGAYAATIIFSCFIGTYLDLLFVGNEMYAFPARPFSNVFTINIAFTLCILPLFTALFLVIIKRLSALAKVVLTVFIGLGMSVSEQFAENTGWFTHSEAWHHSYSFFGYMLFMFLIWKVYQWFL